MTSDWWLGQKEQHREDSEIQSHIRAEWKEGVLLGDTEQTSICKYQVGLAYQEGDLGRDMTDAGLNHLMEVVF